VQYNVFYVSAVDVHKVKYGVIVKKRLYGIDRLIWDVKKATEQHLVVCKSRMFSLFLHRNR